MVTCPPHCFATPPPIGGVAPCWANWRKNDGATGQGSTDAQGHAQAERRRGGGISPHLVGLCRLERAPEGRRGGGGLPPGGFREPPDSPPPSPPPLRPPSAAAPPPRGRPPP